MTTNGIPDADQGARSAAANPRADSPTGSAARQPTWLASLQGLLYKLPGLLSDRVELLSLELQRAGQVLAQIVALIVAAVVVGLTAWLAFWGAVTFALISAGLHWAAASLIVLLINLGIGWWAVGRTRALTPLLHLPATRRHLTLSPSLTTNETTSPDEHSEHPAAASARAH